MGRPRAATYEDQRLQIRQAAAALFAQRGYTAATMLEVAAASGVSKATLYHYFSDKHALLHDIASSHVARLEALVADPFGDAALRDPAQTTSRVTAGPQDRMRSLIVRFMQAYADARSEHRVLTEDVKFLEPQAREEVLQSQRRVVAAFGDAVSRCRPDLPDALHKPLAMLLFGMINWTFTWLQPEGVLNHESLGLIVADLFFGGLGAVAAPSREPSLSQSGLAAGSAVESQQAAVRPLT
jgi:TetR/AcrR family transcriptional regulator